jgi:hypothetical protein
MEQLPIKARASISKDVCSYFLMRSGSWINFDKSATYPVHVKSYARIGSEEAACDVVTFPA